MKFIRISRGLMAVLVSTTVLAGCSTVQSGMSAVGGLFGGGDDESATGSTSNPDSRTEEKKRVAKTERNDTNLSGNAIVIADEPRAVSIARDVFEAGGSAADAAASLYFALSVTYPHAAGLGGGGLCLYYDASARAVESIDFLPRAAQAGGPYAVPGNVRGMALIHTRYGRLPWSQMVERAEALASTGYPISRAFAQRLAANSALVQARPTLMSLYGAADGSVKREGDIVVNRELASTLSFLKSRGAADFYNGVTSKALIDTAAAQGGRISVSDMRTYRPVTVRASAFPFGGKSVHAAAERTGAGALASAFLPPLLADRSFVGADPQQQIAQANAQLANILAGFGVTSALPADFGSTSFVVAGPDGDAVSCGLTMYGPFGSGQLARSAGIVFANSPVAVAEGLAGAFIQPIMVTNEDSDLFWASSSAGGPAAVISSTYLSVGVGIASRQALSQAFTYAPTTAADTVNAMHCPSGWPSNAGACQASADPKGYGLATSSSSTVEADTGGGGFFGIDLF